MFVNDTSISLNTYRAFNIPLGQVKQEAKVLQKDKEIVVMCRSGARSMQAARILKKTGFSSVTNVSGGMMSWQGKTVK